MRNAPLTLEQLRVAVVEGEIDTVVLALVDMQGRLQGKRWSSCCSATRTSRRGSAATAS
ncbi:hypothetical protein [Micromonospora craniellae]|uniref:hypothetical protein n=1 Tax=Micromonospora craniellae TaxID=2294034 RepID=UPI00168B1FF1|nr:hypothetical protein [Micromonospora craniellae]QOC93033.1 hypothetical protein ID554_04790 [Micromonospora craniellae]